MITVLQDDQIKATSEDVTFAAEYVSSNEDVVTVNPAGLVMPTGNGSTEIQIKVGDWSQVVPVTVEGVVPDPAIDFSYSIQPILSTV